MELIDSTQSCKLVNINGELVAFCQTSDFKNYVRNAVNNEMFWRTLLDTWRIDSKIKDEVNNQLLNTNKVRDIAKSEAQKVTDKLVKDQLTNYTLIQIPSHVSKALSEQISGFLNNNSQMNQILTQHSQNQNQLLYNSATETLNKVVNEPQYHIVTNSHIDAMNQRFNESLQCIDKKASCELLKHENTFINRLKEFNQKVSNEIQTLVETKNLVSNMDKQLIDLNLKINKLEQANNTLQLITCITCISVVITGLGIFAYFKH